MEKRGPREAKSENLSHSNTVFSEELPTPTNLAGPLKALTGASQKIIFRYICSGSVSTREIEMTDSRQATVGLSPPRPEPLEKLELDEVKWEGRELRSYFPP